MKSIRTSFHITPESASIVAENNDQAKRINFLINASAAMMESPEFTEQEWMVLLAASNGFVPTYKNGVEQVLYSFASGIPYSAIWGSEYDSINKEALAQRYWALPIHQKLFVFELARKFFLPNNNISSFNSYRDWMIENGARII
jgi:hypothetical protein